MGTYSIIDDDPNGVSRCLHVKLAVVLINLICSTVSLIFLIYCLIKMIKKKKQIKVLTTIILLIFFSEVVQCVSKLLQMLKYAFEDRRYEKEYKMYSRAIICQFQIVLAIYSDYCSLICTFLLSLKCYDALKYKNKYFSNNNRTKLKIIIFTVLGCLLAGLLFLLLDRIICEGNVNYKYDSRDRCSYWCWLGHFSSIICFCFYFIILIANIVLFLKTITFLNAKQRELLEGNEPMLLEVNKLGEEANIKEKDKNLQNSDTKTLTFKNKIKKYKMSNENRVRINDLMLIKIKCTIYPLVTIFIWALFTIYRLVDDIMMNRFDKPDADDVNNYDEMEYFEAHPRFAIIVETFLVIHTVLSSIRGLLYGVSFIVFEEKMFGSFFRKLFGSKSEIDNSYQEISYKIKDEKRKIKEEKKGNETIEEENEDEEGNNNDDEDDDKNDVISGRISENVEMNTSEENC